jgi:hypothetical protein
MLYSLKQNKTKKEQKNSSFINIRNGPAVIGLTGIF